MTKQKRIFGDYPSPELSPRQVERLMRRFKRRIKEFTKNEGIGSECFQQLKAIFEKLQELDRSIEIIAMEIKRQGEKTKPHVSK